MEKHPTFTNNNANPDVFHLITNNLISKILWFFHFNSSEYDNNKENKDPKNNNTVKVFAPYEEQRRIYLEGGKLPKKK